MRLSFVHRAVGGITESDVDLAAVSNATVIGFNVRPDRKARERAELEKVELRLYEVIYQILEDVNSALVGMLQPEFEEVVTGDAEVREVFGVPRIGKVAGCYVLNGVITRGSKVRFLREGTVIWNGAISSLKRFKDDVREVQAGFECGIGLTDFQDLKPGDVIETYDLKEIARTSAYAPVSRGRSTPPLVARLSATEPLLCSLGRPQGGRVSPAFGERAPRDVDDPTCSPGGDEPLGGRAIAGGPRCARSALSRRRQWGSCMRWRFDSSSSSRRASR